MSVPTTCERICNECLPTRRDRRRDSGSQRVWKVGDSRTTVSKRSYSWMHLSRADMTEECLLSSQTFRTQDSNLFLSDPSLAAANSHSRPLPKTLIDPLHRPFGYLRIGRLPAQHVRDDRIQFRLHAMKEVEIASKSFGDVGHLYVLLQCREYFLLGQNTKLFHCVGVNPFLDPAPYGRKIGRRTDDLPGSSSTSQIKLQTMTGCTRVCTRTKTRARISG